MRELQQKQKLKKRMYSMPSLVLLMLLVLLSIRGTWNALSKKLESEQYVKNLEQQSSDLAQRQQTLDQDIQYLKTEEGIDEEIKQRFNVSKAGEKVVIIVDPKNVGSTTDQRGEVWYKRMWNAIMSII